MSETKPEENARRFVVEWLNPGNKPDKPRERLYEMLCSFGKEAEERGRRSENEGCAKVLEFHCMDNLAKEIRARLKEKQK